MSAQNSLNERYNILNSLYEQVNMLNNQLEQINYDEYLQTLRSGKKNINQYNENMKNQIRYQMMQLNNSIAAIEKEIDEIENSL